MFDDDHVKGLVGRLVKEFLVFVERRKKKERRNRESREEKFREMHTSIYTQSKGTTD